MAEVDMIISLETVTDALERLLVPYIMRHPDQVKPKPEVLGELAYCLFDDHLNGRMKWTAGRGRSFERMLDRTWPWLDYGLKTQVGQEVNDLILDPIVEVVDKILLIHVPEFTYDVWVIRKMGLDDVIITNAGDYRIMDWERQQKRGRKKPKQAIISDSDGRIKVPLMRDAGPGIPR